MTDVPPDDILPPKRGGSGSKPGESGQPAYIATEENRRKVMAYAAVGLSQVQMGELLGISVDTLARHHRDELDNGKTMANARVAATLFNKAMSGDTVCMLFWLKTQAGWVEPKAPQPIVGGGADAPPIRSDLSIKVEFVDPPALPAPKP